MLTAAAKAGVPDFVVNARNDTLLVGGTVDAAIARGKEYLKAGATTVFVFGGQRFVTIPEWIQLSKALDGKVNAFLVLLYPNAPGIKALAETGVSRISVGPQLMLKAVEALKMEAEKMLS